MSPSVSRDHYMHCHWWEFWSHDKDVYKNINDIN